MFANQMSPKQITVKITYQAETRRFRLQLPLTLEALRATIRDKFSLRESFNLSYSINEGKASIITSGIFNSALSTKRSLTTTSELESAIEQTGEQPLRLWINHDSQSLIPSTSPLPTFNFTPNAPPSQPHFSVPSYLPYYASSPSQFENPNLINSFTLLPTSAAPASPLVIVNPNSPTTVHAQKPEEIKPSPQSSPIIETNKTQQQQISMPTAESEKKESKEEQIPVINNTNTTNTDATSSTNNNPSPATATAKPRNKFEEGLFTMELLGFENRQQNIALLVKHRGDVNAAVEELYNSQ